MQQNIYFHPHLTYFPKFNTNYFTDKIKQMVQMSSASDRHIERQSFFAGAQICRYRFGERRMNDE